MSLQLSPRCRNAAADAIEATIGTAPKLQIRTGPPPANTDAADTGTLLAELTLPSDWLAVASNGAKSKSGTWQDSSANATGDAEHFRVKDSGGTNCDMQGTVTEFGGGGDLQVENVEVTAGQSFTITNFVFGVGNA